MRSPALGPRLALVAALMIAGAAACAKKAVRKGADAPGAPGAGSSAAESPLSAGVGGVETGAAPPGEEGDASLRGKSFQAAPELAAVRFDYDRYELDEDAKKALRGNAVWLKEYQDAEVRVEGHCDERGTIEYNIALGQRRAKAVRDYYKQLGIPPKRMSTISFGEEKPACEEDTEECWGRNRRAATSLRKD